jgi:hypothetical protein
MDVDYAEPTERPALDPADRSLIADLRLLASDARTLAEAEVAYQKSRASLFGSGIGKIAALLGGAVVLLVLALIALVVGLVFALSPLLTAWGATALVTLALLASALVAAAWARSKWRYLHGLLVDDGADE